MITHKNVRSTAEVIPSIDVNIDTVYIRNKIKRIEEEDFNGWEYDEMQYPKDKYIEELTREEDLSAISMLLSITLAEVDMLKAKLGGI